MLDTAPEHLRKYCFADKNDKAYRQLLNEFNAEDNSLHKIKCTCGNIKFQVYCDPNPTVKAVCPKCGQEIIIYDLIYYPAAVKCPKDDDVFVLEEHNGITEFEVYTVFEYVPEEWEELSKDPDYRFNDDITWCWVYIKCSDEIINIVDDETA